MEELRWPSDCDSDPTSESDMSSVPSSPSDSARVPMLSSLLSALMADMQIKSASEMANNQTFCGVDKFLFRDNDVVEVPDIRWVSDLVDF
jgi:hypothetical protein